MANIPGDLLYTEEHEYVRKGKGAGDPVEIGITDYAQGELGDIVYIELPKVGTKFGKHDVFGTIEAVKAVSELFSPIAGEVVAINDRLDKEPALVNTDAVMRFPYAEGNDHIDQPGTKLADLPGGPLNHHWTKGLAANRDGSKLYASIGSNSNAGENGHADHQPP